MAAKRLTLRLLVASFLAFGGLGILASPAESQAETESCSFTIVRDSKPSVRWTALDLGDDEHVTVERQTFGRFWWRGRPTVRFFEDAPAPKGAASITYRLAIRSADGSVIRRIKCPLETAGSSCSATQTAEGYEIRTLMNVDATEFVVRRQVKDGGEMHWRKLVKRSGDHSVQTWNDGPSPTGAATYQVWTRRNGVIIAGLQCGPSKPPNACVTPLKDPVPDHLRIPLLNEKLIDAERSELGIEVNLAYLGPDGNVYFVRPTEQITRLDPETGDEDILAELEDWKASQIYHIDTAGGVYLDQWGGGSRSSARDSVGVIVPATHWAFDDAYDGTTAVQLLPDGRTLRRTGYSDPTPEEAAASGYFAYDPFTGVSTRLTGLEGIFVTASLSDGRLTGRSRVLFVDVQIDYDCLIAQEG